MGITERLARFVMETSYEDIPREVVKTAKKAILDGVGVALAGSREEAGRIMAQYVKEWGGGGESRLLGTPWRAPAPEAALANGTMAHALDYDDVATGWISHPTVAILPAVLALGEREHLSGRGALEAYILGFEVGAKIGYGLGHRHYEAGFHSTATLGTMAAAAASAKVLRLGVPETRRALGIAASEAAGLRQNFGTMTKPFHAGNAARSGVVAALLAGMGFTADESILEGPQSFTQVLSGEGRLDRIIKGLGDPYDIVSPGLETKPYPCCRLTHRCLDALLSLVREHHPHPEEVEDVECRTSDILPQTLIHPRPRTALEAKFSMQFCLAIALLEGEVTLKQFQDAKVKELGVRRLMEKVRFVHPQGVVGLKGLRHPEAVTLKLKGGRTYSREVLHARGAPENPMSQEELVAKYRDCAGLALPPERVERSLELLTHLEELEDLGQLLEAVAG